MQKKEYSFTALSSQSYFGSYDKNVPILYRLSPLALETGSRPIMFFIAVSNIVLNDDTQACNNIQIVP